MQQTDPEEVPDGLEVYDPLPIEEAIFRAWTIPTNPKWQEHVRMIVNAAMPLLGRALCRLEQERGIDPQGPCL